MSTDPQGLSGITEPLPCQRLPFPPQFLLQQKYVGKPIFRQSKTLLQCDNDGSQQTHAYGINEGQLVLATVLDQAQTQVLGALRRRRRKLQK